LGVVSEIFPNITLTRQDVILTYSGVRPLPRANGKNIGDVSRDHSIGRNSLPNTEIPVLSLIGGKWTTFRAFSEQSADAVLSLLGKARKVSTIDMPIGGGRDYPSDVKSRTAILNKLGASGENLLERYGTKALDVQDFMAAYQNKPLASLPSYSAGEITFICKNENVVRLADLLLRRTAITMEGLLSPAVIAETAAIAAGELGWDKKKMAAEIEHATAELARRDVQNVRSAATA
jgi:glycerol-3-phosphate dehydrogenase